MKKIILNDKTEAIVDDEDFDLLSRFKWKKHKGGYFQLTSYNLMHRIIVNAPKGYDVHHKNGNKLDNRKENLEILKTGEHQKYHYHKIVAFQKAHRKYPDIKNCVVCGKEFIVNNRKRKRNKTCSAECAMSMRIQGRLKQCGKISVKTEGIKAVDELERQGYFENESENIK